MTKVVVLTMVLFACGKGDEGKGGGDKGAPAAGGGTDCLVGAWQNKFGDKNVYTFNADKSGTRVYRDEKTTTFNWSLDGANVKLVFPPQGDAREATFTGKIDCAKPEFFMDGGGAMTKI